jgi:hypothetical protein
MHPEIHLIKLQEYEPHALGVTEQLKQRPKLPVRDRIRHRSDAREYLVTLERGDVTLNKIHDLIAKATSRNRALVLCSRVETFEDETMHIPMLDFECGVSDENLCELHEFITAVKEKGLILESGRSYHFYGFNLLSVDKWRDFMSMAGLFTGFTDNRHIHHRLLSKEARLRLAKIEGSDRYLLTPRVISVVL